MASRKSLLFRGTVWAAVLLILLAITTKVIGLYLAGGAVTWSQWLAANTPYFWLWRMALYAAVAFGWWWMRSAPLHQQPTARAVARAALSLALLIELSVWITPP